MTFFFVGDCVVCVCARARVHACVHVCGQLHSCRSITLQLFGPLCACQTLSPPYILTSDHSHIVSLLLN